MIEFLVVVNVVGSGKVIFRLRFKGLFVVEIEEVLLFLVLVIFIILGVKFIKKIISFL